MVAVIYACVYLYVLMFVMTLFVYYCVFISLKNRFLTLNKIYTKTFT